MASVEWKDANSALRFAGSTLCKDRRPEGIELLAQQSVRSLRVEDDLYWVVLNLPNQTSLTLYLGSNEAEATLAARMARGAVTHALEFAFSSQDAKSERAGDDFGVLGMHSVGAPERTH